MKNNKVEGRGGGGDGLKREAELSTFLPLKKGGGGVLETGAYFREGAA